MKASTNQNRMKKELSKNMLKLQFHLNMGNEGMVEVLEEKVKKEEIDRWASIWYDCFQVILKTPSRYKRRLKELQTWDNCNGHEIERQGRIKALKSLIELNE